MSEASRSGELPCKSVFIVGDAYVDIVASGVGRMPALGEDTFSESISILSGGSAGNVAVQLAALGMKPSYLAPFGRDKFANFNLQAMKEANVHMIPIFFDASPTGSCIVLSTSADRAFVSNPGANLNLTVDHLYPYTQSIVRAGHLHLGGYFNVTTLQGPQLCNFISSLQKKGVTVSMDPQYDVSHEWTGKDGNIREVLKLLDTFFPSEHEVTGISKALMGKLQSDDLSLQEACEYLASKCMKPGSILVAKMGALGATAYKVGAGGAFTSFSSSSFDIKAVDFTGAGDAFAAGFIFKFLKSHGNVEISLRFGCAAGSYRCCVVGASVDAPRLAILQQVLLSGNIGAAIASRKVLHQATRLISPKSENALYPQLPSEEKELPVEANTKNPTSFLQRKATLLFLSHAAMFALGSFCVWKRKL